MKRARVAGRDDSAQLMMLAGIVLTISFILTALTLAQVTALEREAAAQGPSTIVGEWRFLHERLQTNLKVGVSTETTIDSFKSTVMPTITATFRNLAAEKGYDLVLRLASDGNYIVTGNEQALLGGTPPGPNYVPAIAKTYDETVSYSHASDGTMDGILWQTPCPDPTGPPGGCIGGVYVFVRLSDGVTSLEESILFHANHV